MRIRKLEYILEVAKRGSISEAALNLHVSVSSVSEAISNVEKEYDVKLFKRSRTGTEPTDVGRIFLEKAFEIENKVWELEREMNAHNSTAKKELSILCSSSALQSLIPKVLSAFKKEHPDVQIKIREHTNDYPTIMEMLKKNEIDIGIITTNEKTWIEWGKAYKDVLHFDTALQGRVFVSVNKSSSLAFKEYITPEELIGETLVLYSNTRKIYDDITEQYGKLNLLFETNNTEIIKNMVLEGIAITFWSDLSIRNNYSTSDGQMVHVPLANYERANVTYGWAHLKKRKLSPEARAFLKMLRSLETNGIL